MASKYVENLLEAAKTLHNEGFELSASYVDAAAERMDRLEKYIVEMHTELYPDKTPPARQLQDNLTRKGSDDPEFRR